jgi:hypothetical protein
MNDTMMDDVTDICVYACTGKTGCLVARRIVELADTPTTILLAGRNVSRVQELHKELLFSSQNVKVLAYPFSVNVDDGDALETLVSYARVVVNCVDVEAHVQAQFRVAKVCAKSGVHYLDLAERYWAASPLFALESSSRIVPACGFDYALPDVAVAQAEHIFQSKRHIPHHVQVTLAIRTGPLGMKWPLQVMASYLQPDRQEKEPPSRVQRPATKSTACGPLIAYSEPLSSWSIPWLLARDTMGFLLHQRGWPFKNMDIRLALPQSLWRAVFLVFYGMLVALFLWPLIAVARAFQIKLLQKFILCILPTVSLGFFCNDEDLIWRASMAIRVHVAIMLSDDKGNDLCYCVSGQSLKLLNSDCMALAALELAKMTGGESGGVLTPAQALDADTDFWTRLCHSRQLQVQVYPLGSDSGKQHQS